jgi:hypothetical protein
MRQKFRIASLVVVPYVVITVSTLGLSSGASRLQMGAAASLGGSGLRAMQAAYVDCQRMHDPGALGPSRSGEPDVRLVDRDSRSQSPAWLRQRQGALERCLREAASAAPASRLAAGAPGGL